MKYARTFALGFILLLLAGYVYYSEIRRGSGQGDGSEDNRSRALVMDKETVESFSLTSAAQTIRCVRDSAGGWWLTEPVRTEGSAEDIMRLLSSLEEASVVRAVADSTADMSDYGLDRPRLAIRIRNRGDRQDQALMLGSKNPAGGCVYARRSGSPEVFLVSTGLTNSLSQGLYDLRLKNVLDFKAGDVDRLALRHGDQLVVCARSLDSWSLQQPIQVRADGAAVDKLLRSLGEARAVEFVGERLGDEKLYGFDQPAAAVELSMRDEARKGLVVGRRIGDVYYAHDTSRQPVFTVDTALVALLTKEANDLRDRSVLCMRPQDVRRIGWQTQTGDLMCGRDSSGAWEILQPFRARADGSVLSELLEKLSGLSAQAFVSDLPANLRPYGLDHPRARIEIMMDGDSLPSVLLVGGNKDGRMYVQNGVAPSVYLVGASFFDIIGMDPVRLRDRKILGFLAHAVNEIEVRHEEATFRASRNAKGQWRTSQGQDLESSAVAEFLSRLQELKAEVFVDERPSDFSAYGLDMPRYKVTLRIRDADAEALLIGVDGPDGMVYVTSGRRDGVCLAESDIMEQVKTFITRRSPGK